MIHANAAAHPNIKLALPLIHDACRQHKKNFGAFFVSNTERLFIQLCARLVQNDVKESNCLNSFSWKRVGRMT